MPRDRRGQLTGRNRSQNRMNHRIPILCIKKAHKHRKRMDESVQQYLLWYFGMGLIFIFLGLIFVCNELAWVFALTHRMRQVRMGGGKDGEQMAAAGLNHDHPCSVVTE